MVIYTHTFKTCFKIQRQNSTGMDRTCNVLWMMSYVHIRARDQPFGPIFGGNSVRYCTDNGSGYSMLCVWWIGTIMHRRRTTPKRTSPIHRGEGELCIAEIMWQLASRHPHSLWSDPCVQSWGAQRELLFTLSDRGSLYCNKEYS